VAIVLAMGVVALAAMAATAMMVTQSTWSRAAELTAAHAQAQTLVLAGADWARAVLSDDRRLSNVDHLAEPWALRLPPMSVEGGELAGQIEDQQGLFNLNNLVRGGKVNAAQLAHFLRLLSTLGLPAELAGTLVDWIDADGEPQPQGGAEDDVYLALQPPYLAANRPLTDLAELALVRGFDDNVRLRLRPFVSALPVFTPVNVNTAPRRFLPRSSRAWAWTVRVTWSPGEIAPIFATAPICLHNFPRASWCRLQTFLSAPITSWRRCA
jgi:general secretion pathway protein K